MSQHITPTVSECTPTNEPRGDPSAAYAWYVVGVLTLGVVGFSGPFGVVAAAIQTLAPAPMRAQVSALLLWCCSVDQRRPAIT